MTRNLTVFAKGQQKKEEETVPCGEESSWKCAPEVQGSGKKFLEVCTKSPGEREASFIGIRKADPERKAPSREAHVGMSVQSLSMPDPSTTKTREQGGAAQCSLLGCGEGVKDFSNKIGCVNQN